jgi:hypothetical protein
VQAAKPAVPVTGETRTPTKSSSEEGHDEPCERFVRMKLETAEVRFWEGR